MQNANTPHRPNPLTFNIEVSLNPSATVQPQDAPGKFRALEQRLLPIIGLFFRMQHCRPLGRLASSFTSAAKGIEDMLVKKFTNGLRGYFGTAMVIGLVEKL